MTSLRLAGPEKKLLVAAAAFLLGIPLFALLHNVFDALAGMTSNVVILGSLMGLLSVASFIAALFVCPAAVVICLVAAVLNPLTSGWKTAPRAILLTLVSAIAVVAAIGWLGGALSQSIRETDAAAGFNGSFEVVKAGYPANWNVYKRPLEDGDVDISFDAAQPIDGAQALKLVVHHADASGRSRNPGLFQVTGAQTGGTYRVSFWLKNQGSRLRLLIDSETPESREPRTPIREVIDAGGTGDDAWRQFVYVYTVPAHYSNIRFELNVLGPGTLWVDDVRIEALPGK